MNDDETRFHKLLAILAARCRTELDEMEIEIYDKELSGAGYARVNTALSRILVDRRPNDPFPSVSFVRSIMNPQADQETRAQLIADRVFGCISRKGYNWQDTSPEPTFQKTMEAEFGWIGAWAVKNMGGWAELCKITTPENSSTIKAQLRKSLVAAVKITDAGYLPGKPFQQTITFDPPLEIGGPSGEIRPGDVMKGMPG
jgi:hypothetical protein